MDHPDGVVIIGAPMDSTLLCQHVRKRDPSIKISLSNRASNERFLELGGKAVEGVTLSTVFDWENQSSPYQTFRKTYLERYRQKPGSFSFYAYNAAQVLLTALKAQKRGQDVKQTLLSIGTFDGLQGKIIFDAYGDVEPSTVSTRIVRDGRFVILE